MEQKYVAFFDSGVGGLTLLTAFCRAYPNCPALYFGDNAHAPYGDRAPGDICRLAFAAFEQIARFPVRAAVVACNTVTAVCIDELRRRFPFPIVGVEPAVRPAVMAARGGRVLLLCTRATLASARVRRLLAAYADTAVVAHCPSRLASAVEEHIFELSALSVRPFLPPGSFDAAVLGCTHYVWLRREFEEALGCPVFDGTEGTLRRLAAAAKLPPPAPFPSAPYAGGALPCGGAEGEDHSAGMADRRAENFPTDLGFRRVAAEGEGVSAGMADQRPGIADHCPGTADRRAEGVSAGTADHRPGTADHRPGTADHRAQTIGFSTQNKNICLQKQPKTGYFFPIFLGSGASFDEKAYRALQK